MNDLILPMLHYILTGGEWGGLSKEVLGGPRVEGSVIYFEMRVGGLCNLLWDEGPVEEGDGVTQQNQKNPTLEENPKR